jgi:cysteine desulfurase/selenocysteine lyase
VVAGRDRTMSFDADRVRRDFPILDRVVNGKPLVYLDNAASNQKPRAVIDAVSHYYENSHANIHRGVYSLSVEATSLYEAARGKLAELIHASTSDEIVFVRGTTEAINLVAQAHTRPNVGPGDEILISYMEHHSNIVPWQFVCEQTGATLRVVPIDDRGELRIDEFEKLLSPRTRLVALAHVSNAIGTINPVEQLIRLAHEHGVLVLLDGAQAIPHLDVDVQALGCDFYAFSGHKMYGPTGIGVLWGRSELLERMDPYQGGGEMIRSVTFEKTVFNKVPHKFEAGTPDIAGAVGLGEAADYLRSLGLRAIAAHENDLLQYATARILDLPGVRVIGTATHKAAVLSFVMGDIHPHDIGTILDQDGIAVRTGHHCAQPIMQHFDIPATTRASFAAYNTRAEVDCLVAGLQHVQELFG